jgi:hypothetical protein
MSVISTDVPLGEPATPARAGILAAPGSLGALVAVAAFVLYWLSALILEARGGTTHFGADAHLYSMLADGTAVDRITRFHPLTTAVAAAWMKLLSPLSPWLTQHQILKGLFALVGAAGVWAAMAALAAVVPRRQVPLWGAVYATSLGVWFFSSIEESKIVTTALAALYIAIYLRLRESWSTRNAVLLTGVLLAACLNEIVAAFLVAIPALDALVRYRWDVLRRGWWIACHALAAPLAFLLLDVVVGRLLEVETDPEGASHLSMLVYYITRNDFSFETIATFAIRWLFFNLAAPSVEAKYGVDESSQFAGDFEPVLSGYLGSPISIALVAVFCALLVVSLLPRFRARPVASMAGVLLGLSAYAFLRTLFFFIVNPGECLLFSSGVTLPLMLLVAIPFAASSFSRKQALLAGFAALLFIVNASFIIGR